MVKHYESDTTFHYPWENVAQGFWKRYPNPYSKHVLSEDVISREKRGNLLLSKRIFTKTNSMPKWGERFINAKLVHIIEESVIDREKKIMTTLTKNIGFSKIMCVVEKVTYRPCSTNPLYTLVSREAWVESEMYGFRKAIEAFGYERFKKNCKKAADGFNIVLTSLFPQIARQEEVPKLPPTERIRDAARETAKRAAELAKGQANSFFASCSSEDFEDILLEDTA